MPGDDGDGEHSLVVEIDEHARAMALDAEHDADHAFGSRGSKLIVVPDSNSPANPKTTVPQTPPAEAMCAPSGVFP